MYGTACRTKTSENGEGVLLDQEVAQVLKILRAMMAPDDGRSGESLMPACLKKTSSWSSVSATFRPPGPIRAADVDEFFGFFRIHIRVCRVSPITWPNFEPSLYKHGASDQVLVRIETIKNFL